MYVLDVVLTCNSKMDYMSIFIIHSPVWVSDRVGKFYQVSKFCSGHNFFDLCSSQNTQQWRAIREAESLTRLHPALHALFTLRAGSAALHSAQGRAAFTGDLVVNALLLFVCHACNLRIRITNTLLIPCVKLFKISIWITSSSCSYRSWKHLFKFLKIRLHSL